MTQKRVFSLMMAGMLSLSLLAGCGNSNANAGQDAAANTPDAPAAAGTASDVAYIQDKGTLVVGITEFAPMDYKNENGEWIGFDADMAKKVAESLGVECQFSEINWDNKIMELENKSIDVVWNGMTLTDDVKAAMECTNPYAMNAQVVVVPADKAEQYADAASLEGLVVAVESGSAGQAAANEAGLDTNEVEAQANALMEVNAGTSDACIIDLLMAGAMIGEGTSYPDLTYTVELTPEEYGIGCRKGSDLAAHINGVLIDSYSDGSMQEIAKTYGIDKNLIEQK